MAVARYLESHPVVEAIRYPGLPKDPSHDIARRQMQRFGPVVSFTLRSREEAERFLRASGLVTEATSFGGVHTTAERRARWGGDAVPEGFIRMSVGCEAIEDLVADLEQALAKIGRH
jgi:cystathionine gamma-lyase